MKVSFTLLSCAPQVKPDWPTGIAVGRCYYKGGTLGGSNLDGSVKSKPVTAKEMTSNEISELTKLLDASFKGVK